MGESLLLPDGFAPKYWRYWVPNAITLLACATGLSAVHFALKGLYGWCVIVILVAGILDTLDGPAARALGASSEFGAQLDSLMDLVNFGVTPSIVLYLWSLHELNWVGFAACLVYVMCMACRLARFNAGIDFNAAQWSRSYFMGVPAPAGAFLALIPIIFSFEFPLLFQMLVKAQPLALVVYTLLVGFVCISKLPTFSSKLLNKSWLRGGKLLIVLGGVLGCIAGFVVAPWRTFLALAAVYYLSFPASYVSFRLAARRNQPVKKVK
ncbi:Phosphatidylcholine/phosphatidylserine synthase [Balamuthia mandrillaris]